MTAPAKRDLVDVEGRPIPRSMPPGYLDEWLAGVRDMHERMRKRRKGAGIEVDDLLDELRGREHPPPP